MVFALVAKIICWRLFAVTPGKQPYFASFRATLAGLVPLTTLRKQHPSVIVQWLCHRETVCTLSFRRGRLPLRCARDVTIY